MFLAMYYNNYCFYANNCQTEEICFKMWIVICIKDKRRKKILLILVAAIYAKGLYLFIR